MSEPVWADVWIWIGSKRKRVGVRAAGGRVLVRAPHAAVMAFELDAADEFSQCFASAVELARQQSDRQCEDQAPTQGDTRVFKLRG